MNASRSTRRFAWCLGLLFAATLAVSLGSELPLLAQQAPPAPAPVPVVTLSRSYVLDAALFVLLVGGAVYAVCRSSRRT